MVPHKVRLATWDNDRQLEGGRIVGLIRLTDGVVRIELRGHGISSVPRSAPLDLTGRGPPLRVWLRDHPEAPVFPGRDLDPNQRWRSLRGKLDPMAFQLALGVGKAKLGHEAARDLALNDRAHRDRDHVTFRRNEWVREQSGDTVRLRNDLKVDSLNGSKHCGHQPNDRSSIT